MRRTVILAAVVTLVIAVPAVSADTARARPSPCVVYTFGWRTPGGHEANAPVTMCGTGATRPLICEGSAPAGTPGARFTCYPVPATRKG